MTIMLIPFLSGCFSEPEESSVTDTSDVIAETTHKEIEPLILNSFCGREISFYQDQYEDFISFLPEEGSAEFERWGIIFAERPEGDDVMIYQNDGEMYEIFFVGEIEQMQDSEYGFIKELHSFRIKKSPREYGGITYEVAVLRENHDMTKIKDDFGNPYLLAKSRSELKKLFNRYFMFPTEMPADAADWVKESVTSYNNRLSLLNGYDSEFFKKYDLFMIFQEAGSGSIRYDVTDITIESGICTVIYEELNPPGTADMADWILFVSIPKEISAQITEYKTYLPKPEWYS